MEQTEENLAWARKKWLVLADIYRFQFQQRDTVDHLAKQLLRIVRTNEEINHGYLEDGTPDPDERWNGIPRLGKIRPGDWLIDQAIATEDFFPTPKRLREIYGRYWTPADGIRGSE